MKCLGYSFNSLVLPFIFFSHPSLSLFLIHSPRLTPPPCRSAVAGASTLLHRRRPPRPPALHCFSRGRSPCSQPPMPRGTCVARRLLPSSTALGQAPGGRTGAPAVATRLADAASAPRATGEAHSSRICGRRRMHARGAADAVQVSEIPLGSAGH